MNFIEQNDQEDMSYELVNKRKNSKQQFLHDYQFMQASQQEEIFIKKHTNLKIKENLQIKNIPINDSETQWLHTLIYSDQTSVIEEHTPIVLMHGYSNTSLGFYKMMSHLGQQRTVYSIDWLGNGLSSRKTCENDEPKQIINYFIDSLELWRQRIGLQQMVLIGHSFGGFLCAHYAVKYPQHVKSLHLMSPIGSTKVTELQAEFYENDMVSSLCCLNKVLYKKYVKPGWEQQENPHTLMQWKCMPSSCILRCIVKFLYKMRFGESADFRNYLKAVYAIDNDSALKSFNNLFNFPQLTAKNQLSLQEILPMGLQCYVNFYFGDKDWMESEGAQILVSSKLVQGTYTIIKNSNHDIQFDNPDEISQQILEKIKMNENYAEQIKQQLKLENQNSNEI